MKLSEVLGSKPIQSKTRRRLTVGLIITGILAVVIVFITVYGHYTGTHLIGVTNELSQKGIAVSSNRDFGDETSKIEFEPVTPAKGVEDITEDFLNIDAAIKNDGQYYKPGQQYIAYTFYLRNTGQEAIDIGYFIRIVTDYKDIGKATFIKVIEFETNSETEFVTSKQGVNYSKALIDSDTIADERIDNFKPGDFKKFTFFVWFDGFHSDNTMIGGSIKLEWIFGILNAEAEQ